MMEILVRLLHSSTIPCNNHTHDADEAIETSMTYPTISGCSSQSYHGNISKQQSYSGTYYFYDMIDGEDVLLPPALFQNGLRTSNSSNSTNNDSTPAEVYELWNVILVVTLCVAFVLFFCCSKPEQWLGFSGGRQNDSEAARKQKQRDEKEKRLHAIRNSLVFQKVIAAPDEEGCILLGAIGQSNEQNDKIKVVQETDACSGFHSSKQQLSAKMESTNTNDIENKRECTMTNEDINDATETMSVCSINSLYGCCCSICLEPYRVGDEVAWSRLAAKQTTNNDSCSHVFHKACLVTWLLQKNRHRNNITPRNFQQEFDNCPACRRKILFSKTSFLGIVEDNPNNESEKCNDKNNENWQNKFLIAPTGLIIPYGDAE